MNILITDSNGFVGSKLMYYLEDKGHAVKGIDKREDCIIDRYPGTIIGNIRNIDDLKKMDDDFGISTEKYFSNNEYVTKILAQYAKDKKLTK